MLPLNDLRKVIYYGTFFLPCAALCICRLHWLGISGQAAILAAATVRKQAPARCGKRVDQLQRVTACRLQLQLAPEGTSPVPEPTPAAAVLGSLTSWKDLAEPWRALWRAQ